MFRKKLIPVILAAFLFAGFTFAQQLPKKPQEPPKPPTKEQRLEHLTKNLALNNEQVKEVDKILENSKEKLDDIHMKFREATNEMMDEIRQVRDQENQQIDKNLNDTQKKIFAEMQKEMKNHRPPMRDGQRPPQDIPQGPPPPGR